MNKYVVEPVPILEEQIISCMRQKILLKQPSFSLWMIQPLEACQAHCSSPHSNTFHANLFSALLLMLFSCFGMTLTFLYLLTIGHFKV